MEQSRFGVEHKSLAIDVKLFELFHSVSKSLQIFAQVINDFLLIYLNAIKYIILFL